MQREGRGIWLRSEVLALDLRSRRRDGATLVVFRDPQTGNEFTGELKEAERRLRIAENRAAEAEKRANRAENRASAAEERARAAESHAQDEAGLRHAAEDRASAAEGRIRALEERLRNVTARAARLGRES
ncbi:MAG: hypothetical protein OXH99_25570 [Bryobacterales bacterium]|nr:hypothetical protein [Bryobacterales bacterium]